MIEERKVMNDLASSVTTVVLAIVALATIAVILSRNANTSGVISSAGQALSNTLTAAQAPISQGSFTGLSAALP